MVFVQYHLTSLFTSSFFLCVTPPLALITQQSLTPKTACSASKYTPHAASDPRQGCPTSFVLSVRLSEFPVLSVVASVGIVLVVVASVVVLVVLVVIVIVIVVLVVIVILSVVIVSVVFVGVIILVVVVAAAFPSLFLWLSLHLHLHLLSRSLDTS